MSNENHHRPKQSVVQAWIPEQNATGTRQASALFPKPLNGNPKAFRNRIGHCRAAGATSSIGRGAEIPSQVLALSQKDRERFPREARSASALDHSNPGMIYGIDKTNDGGMFIVDLDAE